MSKYYDAVIIGGGIFVGTIYWLLYLRPGAPKSKSGFEV